MDPRAVRPRMNLGKLLSPPQVSNFCCGYWFCIRPKVAIKACRAVSRTACGSGVGPAGATGEADVAAVAAGFVAGVVEAAFPVTVGDGDTVADAVGAGPGGMGGVAGGTATETGVSSLKRRHVGLTDPTNPGQNVGGHLGTDHGFGEPAEIHVHKSAHVRRKDDMDSKTVGIVVRAIRAIRVRTNGDKRVGWSVGPEQDGLQQIHSLSRRIQSGCRGGGAGGRARGGGWRGDGGRDGWRDRPDDGGSN